VKIRIALCDNDSKALSVIAGATESVFRDQNFQPYVDRFQKCEDLLLALEQAKYQITLLDIDMPDIDGIEAAKRIREKGINTQIVFVSSREDRVFEALRVQPFGFVRKNNFFEDLMAVVDLYVNTCVGGEAVGRIDLPTRSSTVSLEGEKIRFIEGSRNYQILYQTGDAEPVEVKLTMDKLETMMEPFGFIRIHKGYLVNYRYIQRIAYDHVILRDGTSLPVGRSKVTEIKTKFLSLLDD
jgi:DNA-binding LytR/AlgR family response regulator